MNRQRYETGTAPKIHIDACNGDLKVSVAQEASVLAEGDEYTVKEVDRQMFIHSDGDLRLHIPPLSSLVIDEVNGDLSLRQIQGGTSIKKVNGDAVLSELKGAKIGEVNGDLVIKQFNGAANVEAVRGDMSAQHVAGDLNVGSVDGDLNGRHVNGSITVQSVSGDVNLKWVAGDLHVDSGSRDVNVTRAGGKLTLPAVAGDIRLTGGLPAGDHALEASGDIVLRWPENASVNLIARAATIDNRLSFDSAHTKDDGTLVATIGDSKTNLSLAASGRIVLKPSESTSQGWSDFEMGDLDRDLDDLGERISAQVTENMSRLAVEMELRFGDLGQEVAEKVMRKAEKAAERAAAKAERVQQKANRRGGFAPPPPPPPSPPKRQASTEEQMKILRMVESGAISPEDANMLLEALEG